MEGKSISNPAPPNHYYCATFLRGCAIVVPRRVGSGFETSSNLAVCWCSTTNMVGKLLTHNSVAHGTPHIQSETSFWSNRLAGTKCSVGTKCWATEASSWWHERTSRMKPMDSALQSSSVYPANTMIPTQLYLPPTNQLHVHVHLTTLPTSKSCQRLQLPKWQGLGKWCLFWAALVCSTTLNTCVCVHLTQPPTSLCWARIWLHITTSEEEEHYDKKCT